METTTASSVSDYMVVRLPATPEEGHLLFRIFLSDHFPFLVARVTFTSVYTYVRFHYPEYAQTALPFLEGGELVELELAPLLIQEVFGGMTLPEPELLHQHRACTYRTCTFCQEEEAMYDPPEPCRHCAKPECYGDCRDPEDCEDCGRPWCKGDCYDRREVDGYESDDFNHGPRCRCCGCEDDEIGNRYAGYCGYDCAHEAREW
jgi:hypothetical protein